MKDVAKLAKVSRTTVSFVINNSPEAKAIPLETQEKVWAAVRELGYRPNITAQNLRAQRSNTIGFISDEVATTPYAGQLIQGAQDAAWELGMILLLVNTGKDPEMERAAIDTMLGRQVDGIIYAAMYHQEVNPSPNIYEAPTVLLDCYTADHSLSSVVPDEMLGGKTATETLIAKGHRRIAFINTNDNIPAKDGRARGYRAALEAHNLDYDQALVRETASDTQDAYHVTLQLMKLSDPPTAVFCFNDQIAMDTYDALRRLNLSIPDDVAVIGFDNQEIIATHLYPPLTTVQLPHYEMGKWAVNKLISSDATIEHHLMVCPLIERRSV
jgi:LacI family transcriptional regulator